MKKGLTEIIFILDRSGSMVGLEKDTIGGYNSMINRQKKEVGESLITTILFDDRCRLLHNRVPISDMKEMTENDYYARGATALLDAIGDAVQYISEIHNKIKKSNRPERTLFIIMTDGMENSSHKYSYEMVKKMVEKKKKKRGWEFLFLGANMDAITEANKFGIRPEFATNFLSDEAGTALNYGTVCMAISKFRNNAPITSDWKITIEDDYSKRNVKGDKNV